MKRGHSKRQQSRTNHRQQMLRHVQGGGGCGRGSQQWIRHLQEQHALQLFQGIQWEDTRTAPVSAQEWLQAAEVEPIDSNNKNGLQQMGQGSDTTQCCRIFFWAATKSDNIAASNLCFHSCILQAQQAKSLGQ